MFQISSDILEKHLFIRKLFHFVIRITKDSNIAKCAIGTLLTRRVLPWCAFYIVDERDNNTFRSFSTKTNGARTMAVTSQILVFWEHNL